MRRGVACAAVAVCLLVPGAAWGKKQAPITGKLSKSGYTIIALGYNGKAVSSKSRSFKIVPRDGKVTLQLRDKKGRYAGPVVVGGKGSKVIVGVKAGAKLGTIRIRSGYATAAKVS